MKKIPLKQVWTHLKTFWVNLKIRKSFHFFEIFRLLDPPGCTEQKISIKSPQNMFGHSKERFWTLLKFQIVFDFFFRIVPCFDPSVCTGHFFFEKKPQNKSKTRLNTFGNVFGYLEFWEVFAFLWNFSTSLPSRVHWPKNLEKITSKHVWTILETFLDIFENLNSFRFLWNFFESPRCTGQSFFPSK